jgi:murein DD-endopeptidase MepM/ murein hydrolase activator NlpD
MASIASATDVWRTPGPFPDEMDTWFGTVYNTTAQHDTRLRVGGWGDDYYTLLRFNLSGLPQTATSARIWLAPISDGGTLTPINWYQIGAQWHSASVTRDNFPYSSLTGLFSSVAPTLGYWYIIDITTEYNQWRSGTGVLNYGFLLAPVYNNNNYSSFSSAQGGYGPQLQVTYTPQANDSILKLKWPLPTTKPSTPTSAFGDYWGPGQAYCNGQPMSHSGVDVPASAGTAIYAAEDGIVKEVLPASQSGGWASAIVMEHTSPSNTKYTTVYWHIDPVADTASAGGFVPKGMQIATVADLTPYGNPTHFHFGVRMGAYDSTYSDKGALPTGYCSQLATFPENFINPWDTSLVNFQ